MGSTQCQVIFYLKPSVGDEFFPLKFMTPSIFLLSLSPTSILSSSCYIPSFSPACVSTTFVKITFSKIFPFLLCLSCIVVMQRKQARIVHSKNCGGIVPPCMVSLSHHVWWDSVVSVVPPHLVGISHFILRWEEHTLRVYWWGNPTSKGVEVTPILVEYSHCWQCMHACCHKYILKSHINKQEKRTKELHSME